MAVRDAYDELHRLAGAYLRRERPDHTLSPTLSVHENTIARDLRLAQTWLHRHMMEASGRGDGAP